MSHTIRHKQKLLHRVSRIGGQVEAIKRALEGEAGCSEVMHLIAGCRGAINGLLAEVVEDHIRTHLVDRARNHARLSKVGRFSHVTVEVRRRAAAEAC
jgi:FrmR/RcnR family transcriptional regulator, repressor of frmRAB operon